MLIDKQSKNNLIRTNETKTFVNQRTVGLDTFNLKLTQIPILKHRKH
jgi:hypothetical protein